VEEQENDGAGGAAGIEGEEERKRYYLAAPALYRACAGTAETYYITRKSVA